MQSLTDANDAQIQKSLHVLISRNFPSTARAKTHIPLEHTSVPASSDCLEFVMENMFDVDMTYRGAAIRQGRHADRHAHLIRGGEGGWGGAPLLHFLPLEEVTPGPLNTEEMAYENRHG